MREERRREDRHHLIHYLRIFDRDSGEEIGNLVNINKSGVMVVSGMPIEEGKFLRLRMEFPEEIDGKREIEFDAETRWLETSEKFGLIAIGMKSHNMHPNDLKTLEALIAFYKDDEE